MTLLTSFLVVCTAAVVPCVAMFRGPAIASLSHAVSLDLHFSLTFARSCSQQFARHVFSRSVYSKCLCSTTRYLPALSASYWVQSGQVQSYMLPRVLPFLWAFNLCSISVVACCSRQPTLISVESGIVPAFESPV